MCRAIVLRCSSYRSCSRPYTAVRGPVHPPRGACLPSPKARYAKQHSTAEDMMCGAGVEGLQADDLEAFAMGAGVQSGAGMRAAAYGVAQYTLPASWHARHISLSAGHASGRMSPQAAAHPLGASTARRCSPSSAAKACRVVPIIRRRRLRRQLSAAARAPCARVRLPRVVGGSARRIWRPTSRSTHRRQREFRIDHNGQRLDSGRITG
jgi:hypothetical protein